MTTEFFSASRHFPGILEPGHARRAALSMLAALFLLVFLGGCVNQPPRQETMAEQDAYMTQEQCSQEASNIYPAFPNPQNPFWNDYYVMCMENMGVPGYAIERGLDGAGWDPELF